MAQDGADYRGEPTKKKEAPPEAAEDTAPEEASGEDDEEEVEAEAEADESSESEDTDSDQEEAEEVEPEEAIDPPPSWSAADKEAFRELPVVAQRAIAQREAQRERFVNEKAREIAETRKAIEAEREALQLERQTKIGQIDTALSVLANEINGEFSNVNWQELATTDPAEYVAKKAKYDARMQAFHQAQSQRNQEATRAKADAEERQKHQASQYVQGQHQRLLEAVPEWADADKAKAEKTELLHAAKNHYGFTDDELGQLYDHRTVLVLRDAAKYRALQKAKPKVAKKVVNAPKVQKPGNQNTSSKDTRNSRLADKRKQLRKTGRMENAASVFEEFID
jgi:hypothetical protein